VHRKVKGIKNFQFQSEMIKWRIKLFFFLFGFLQIDAAKFARQENVFNFLRRIEKN
jgi:hypothetical protein